MQRRAAIAAVVGATLSGCLGTTVQQSSDNNQSSEIPTDVEVLESEIVSLTNDRRAEADIPRTDRSERLDVVAKTHAERMVEEGFFAHETPDGEDTADRLPCSSGAENLNEGYRNRTLEYSNGDMIAPLTEKQMARYTVKSWMLSGGHKSNILDREWSQQGVGVAIDGSGGRFRFLVTQLFCG